MGIVVEVLVELLDDPAKQANVQGLSQSVARVDCLLKRSWHDLVALFACQCPIFVKLLVSISLLEGEDSPDDSTTRVVRAVMKSAGFTLKCSQALRNEVEVE